MAVALSPVGLPASLGAPILKTAEIPYIVWSVFLFATVVAAEGIVAGSGQAPDGPALRGPFLGPLIRCWVRKLRCRRPRIRSMVRSLSSVMCLAHWFRSRSCPLSCRRFPSFRHRSRCSRRRPLRRPASRLGTTVVWSIAVFSRASSSSVQTTARKPFRWVLMSVCPLRCLALDPICCRC